VSVKNKIRIILMTLLLIGLVLLLSGCSPFLQIDTNIPLRTTTLTFINNTDSHLSFFIDGVEKVTVPPAQTKTFNYWVGGGAYYWNIQVSVTVMDRQKNRSWSDVVYFSSYYKLSYVFTAREDENGRLQVESRN